MTHIYYADISCDDEAGVWFVSNSDIPGLVAEAASQPGLLLKIRELVPELYGLNRHLFDQPKLETIPLRMTSIWLETIRVTP